MFPSKKINFALCIISGLLMGFSFPPFKTWYLSYFGLAILIFLILDSKRYRQFFGRTYLALFFWNALSLYWIAGWQSDDIFLKLGGIATVLIHPIFFIIFLSIFYAVKKNLGEKISLLSFPFIWTGFEYFHNNTQFSFPWIELGNTETYNLNRIQYADIVGVHGITFLVCLIAVLLYLVLVKIISKEWEVGSRQSIIVYTILIGLFISPNLYSYKYLNQNETLEKYYKTPDASKRVKSSIVQPNVDPHRKWTGSVDSLVDKYILKLNEALRNHSDLIVLHETATPYYFLESYNWRNTKKFFDYAEKNQKYLLMGIPHAVVYDDSLTATTTSRINSVTKKRYDAYNSAILIESDKDKKDLTIHKKVKLVPFSENVPYAQSLPFLKKWMSWGVGISSWTAGNELKMFELNNPKFSERTKFATLICFESVFSEYASEAAKNGAEFLVIVTNDGWWGKSFGPYQHEQYAVLRAVENRKWIIRAAQTGVSCYIDPVGNIYEATELNTEAIISKEIIANSEKTFYSINGDIIGRVSYYLSGIAVLLSVIGYAYNRKVKSIA